MSFRSAGVIALISASAVLLAGEFWQDKQPSDWTEKEIQRLVTKSPWAKEAILTMGGGHMGQMEAAASAAVAEAWVGWAVAEAWVALVAWAAVVAWAAREGARVGRQVAPITRPWLLRRWSYAGIAPRRCATWRLARERPRM